MPSSRKRATALVGMSIAALAAAAGGAVSQAAADTPSAICSSKIFMKCPVPPPSTQNQQVNNNAQDQSGAQTGNAP